MENDKKNIREVRTVKRFLKSLHETIGFLVRTKQTFTISMTSYTATLKIQGDKVKYLYTKDGRVQDFSLVSKIKGQIKKSNLHVDNVRTSNVKYFSLTNLKPCKHKIIYNIDINDCYPTTLKNLGFITKEFHEEISKIEKIKKLKSLGQIATKSTIYEYIDGENTKIYQKSNEYFRNVWFTICQETGETINECKNNIDSFLFFWFDGIYFKNKNDAEKIKEILTKRGYKFKDEVLKNFEVKKTKSNLIINYDKDGKRKTFNLPLPVENESEYKRNNIKINENFKNEKD